MRETANPWKSSLAHFVLDRRTTGCPSKVDRIRSFAVLSLCRSSSLQSRCSVSINIVSLSITLPILPLSYQEGGTTLMACAAKTLRVRFYSSVRYAVRDVIVSPRFNPSRLRSITIVFVAFHKDPRKNRRTPRPQGTTASQPASVLTCDMGESE